MLLLGPWPTVSFVCDRRYGLRIQSCLDICVSVTVAVCLWFLWVHSREWNWGPSQAHGSHPSLRHLWKALLLCTIHTPLLKGHRSHLLSFCPGRTGCRRRRCGLTTSLESGGAGAPRHRVAPFQSCFDCSGSFARNACMDFRISLSTSNNNDNKKWLGFCVGF